MKSTRNVSVKIKGFVVFVFICCFGSSALATDYYVSPTGSASWSACRNINTPCSLQTAAQNAAAGDTIYFRGGKYNLPFVDTSGTKYWEMGFKPTHSGIASHPIIFMAYPGEDVFLDNSANAGQTNPVSSYGAHCRDYIVFDGLNTSVALSDGKGKGATLHGSTGSIIKNCAIEGSSGGTSNNNCIRLEHASNCTILNCKLFNSTGSNENSNAICFYSVSNTYVENCEIYDTTAGFYDKDGSENNTYRYNYFHDNSLAYSIRTASTGPAPHDIELYQNVFKTNTNDIEFCGGKTKTNIHVYSNVIYSNGGKGINCWSGGPVNTLNVFNNIFVGSGIATKYTLATNIYSDYNVFYKVSSGYDGGANSHTNDPDFVNPGGSNSPEDYKRTSYPRDGRGGSYPSLRGAYITGNEVIGYSGEGGPPSSPPDFSANN